METFWKSGMDRSLPLFLFGRRNPFRCVRVQERTTLRSRKRKNGVASPRGTKFWTTKFKSEQHLDHQESCRFCQIFVRRFTTKDAICERSLFAKSQRSRNGIFVVFTFCSQPFARSGNAMSIGFGRFVTKRTKTAQTKSTTKIPSCTTTTTSTRDGSFQSQRRDRSIRTHTHRKTSPPSSHLLLKSFLGSCEKFFRI